MLAEKPIATDARTGWRLVETIEVTRRIVAVNLFNRNAWYHEQILAFIASGQIGKLAIIRVCHMTPGLMPGEGHGPEGLPFHDCGMHYADVARWYARSEYRTWHAQGVCMWGHADPWWVHAHGTFDNGVVFDLTQGFVYGHLAKDKISNCYLEAIGTQGVCRMRHDFRCATVECHGVTETLARPGTATTSSWTSWSTGSREAFSRERTPAALSRAIVWSRAGCLGNARRRVEERLPAYRQHERTDGDSPASSDAA